jgi:predicted nucleic acid-binding protein
VEYTKTLERYLNNTIKVIDCISLDVAKRASKIYQRTKGNEQDRRKKGKGSSDVDILMATIALSEDAIIISHDDDFKRVEGLETENWEL